MKKLIPVFLLLLSTNVYAAPSNTMSITPTAVAGTTITAADENTRNNEISSKYNAHSHTDISQVTNTLNVGDGNSGNKTIQANNTDLNKPSIYWDDTNDIWVATRDGVTAMTFVVVTGAQVTKSILPQSPSDNQHLQYDSNTSLWLNSNEIDINSGTIDGVTIGASSAPTVTNLGTVTTADINGGTIDGTTIGATSATTGKFTTVTGNSAHFNETTAPATSASQGAIYTKDTSGQPELFYREESSGDEVQMTTGGRVNSQFKLFSTNTITSVSTTTDIPITTEKTYLVIMELQDDSGEESWSLRFNSNSSGSYADTFPGAAGATTEITFNSAAKNFMRGQFWIDTHQFTPTSGSKLSATVKGEVMAYSAAANVLFENIRGIYSENTAVSSFEVIAGSEFSGTIDVYELNR